MKTAFLPRRTNFLSAMAIASLVNVFTLQAQDTSITLLPLEVKGTGASPLQQAPSLDKTGTKLEDIPTSIQIVPIETINEQGGYTLSSAIRDVSSVNMGGPSSYGFFDRFTIRGLDARIFTDGFSDGDLLNGYPHSLVGVSEIEVLKGPGSALLGNGPPGGSINLVHFVPSSTASYGVSGEVGSYNTYSGSLYATGPTDLKDLNYRLDASADHSDGFRGLKSADYEVRPVLSWTRDNHLITLAIDAQYIERTPDSYGILYVNGTPLSSVPSDTKYSTPFAHGNQNVEHTTLSDAWKVSKVLTLNDRFSYLHRDVDILRNSGGSTIADSEEMKRQLREQTDHDNDLNYQFEPVWKFNTGPVAHTLLTGAQVERQYIDDNRATADLPNITDIYAPVIPETSTAGLTFMRNAAHSGMVDDLAATFLGTYATDQIDVTRDFKIRLSIRQDWWFEQLTPQDSVPGRFQPNTDLAFRPGVTYKRTDKPLSWSAGTLYKLPYGISPFIGASQSYLTNFNSEATQSGIYAPESGLEYEAGIKFNAFKGRAVLTTSVFKITRDNVFTEVTQPDGTDSVLFDDQETRGVEADMQVEPIPHWNLLANGTLQHALLTNQPNNTSYNGKQPVGVPERILNLWTTYDFPIAGVPGFKIGAGTIYNSKSYGNMPNTNSIPGYTVCDAMVGYYGSRWDAELGVKNIADVTYYTTALSAGGEPGLPRNEYLKANYHW